VRKNIFYIHANIVTKKWEQKNARNNFTRNTRILRKKNVGKNRLKKMRKNVFCIHTNIVTKNEDKKMHESICPETHDFCELKIVCKKGEKSFLYTHEYRHQKMGTKKCTKQFFQKHTNSAS